MIAGTPTSGDWARPAPGKSTEFAIDYRPYMHGNNETVTITRPQAGSWHIMLQGWDAYSGVTLGLWAW